MRKVIFIFCFWSAGCLALSEAQRGYIAQASEAAPSHITNDATYMDFKDGRFVKIKTGKNNFTCLVVHEPKGRFEPSCFNDEAVRTILPAYEMHMKLLYQGLSYEKTYEALDKAFKNGKLPTAETGALVYMMSPNNKFYHDGKLSHSPVHQMYFYPKLEDKVFSLGEGPVFLWQGFPHLSALIVTVPAVD